MATDVGVHKGWLPQLIGEAPQLDPRSQLSRLRRGRCACLRDLRLLCGILQMGGSLLQGRLGRPVDPPHPQGFLLVHGIFELFFGALLFSMAIVCFVDAKQSGSVLAGPWSFIQDK
eukprot:756386-Hanusia_phi.AAC.2